MSCVMGTEHFGTPSQNGTMGSNKKDKRKRTGDRILMNFLCVDTSSGYMTVVASVNGKEYVSFSNNCSMRHSTLLMSAIDELLSKNNLSITDFDFFSAVVGAGSFTGLRIGISTMKGFALATNKPTLPVSTFEMCAYNMENKTDKILAVSDALHDYYYVSGYEKGKNTVPPSYVSKEEVENYKNQGYTLCSLEKIELLETEVISADKALVNAVKILCEKQENYGELKALYIRKSQAEINYENSNK